MKNPNSLQDDLTQRLADSVERLQQQADKVSYWASAITGTSQPVPEYEPESTAVDRYIKAARPARKRRRRATNRIEETEDGKTRSRDEGNGPDSTPASA